MTEELEVPGTKRTGEGGYLLLETLVASALLLVALLAIMPLYTMATKQNAFAKDITIAATLALDKAEEFSRWPCKKIRRGTCCFEPETADLASLAGGTCQNDDIKVEGITYRRSCVIKQNVAAGKYSQDNDSQSASKDVYGMDVYGVAWIEVTVRPLRSSHLAKRNIKPAINTYLRVCEP